MKTTAPNKIKSTLLFALLLSSIMFTFSFLPLAKAETKIASINPTSGYVGTNVTLTANVSNLGTYRILFDETEILSGEATENNITVNFIIPHAPHGNHNITLVDAMGENDIKTFTILTFQSLEPQVPEPPAQLQEGANLVITVNVTGGVANYAYPKIKVQTPRGDLNYTLRNDINIITDAFGDCLLNVTYPDDFVEGANTNYTGYYKIFFNETVAEFFVGITNASVYHRGDIVNIKAVNYPINENVNITIKFGNETIHTELYNATDGAVNYDWLIPNTMLLSNATHTYNVTITPVPTAKNLTDTQIFDIPGFNTTVYTLNLAGKGVSDVLLNVHDVYANTNYTSRSGSGGYANFMLEIGDYTAEAYFKDVKVGEGFSFSVTREALLNFSFTCNITGLNIIVVNELGVRIPQVNLTLAYNYTTNYGTPENRTATEYNQTDINGLAVFPLVLTNVTCVVNASLYGIVFNVGNNTIYDLPAAEYVNVTVLYPTRRLNVQVLDANNQPIPSATLKAQELTVGLFVDGEAVNGNITLNCYFGRYSVKVFFGDILLNETVFDLTSSDAEFNVTVKCQLYGLNIAVRVVDYFGQPISGANVILHSGSLQDAKQTDSGGTAAFPSVIGGEMQLEVYMPGHSEPCVIKSFNVVGSTVLTVKVDRYVVLAGFLVETGTLAAAIVVAVPAILIIILEVYRRRRSKRQEVKEEHK
ncbi:MAG: carboxypeptidase-like regulatory domain-containing protein [Candidatus Bathyarchaeales archaeon]